MTLDDFGTGYASLSYISRFPLDRLKIDRSFIREAGKNRSASSLVNAVVAMAFSLGMNSVAEGVETEAQRSFLISSGCNELQGFYFGRPAPAEKFGTIVASGLQV
jgi:EAL domain-containing protein (putative c-di-GMP-specific phosphodiesterase class I)